MPDTGAKVNDSRHLRACRQGLGDLLQRLPLGGDAPDHFDGGGSQHQGGRRRMIAATYGLSAALLLLTGWLFAADSLTVVTLTALWTAIFFIASPAASSAYLTVSEIFPLETRGLAIAVFVALGTGAGGVAAPWLFGTLIGTGSRINVFYGYAAAAALMLAAAAIEVVWGVAAERQSLEKIAEPLSARAHVP